MQKYIRQLVGDLYAVEEREGLVPASEQTLRYSDEELEMVEAWVNDVGPHYRIGELFQLQAIQFPPAERLNRRQLRAVCEAYECALSAFAIMVNFPRRLPWATRYRLLVSLLDHEVSMLNGSAFVDIDLCNYDIEHCPFGSRYCSCKKTAACLPDFHLDLSAQAKTIIQSLRTPVDLLPAGKFFSIHESEAAHEPGAAKTIAEWLGIDLGALPGFDDLDRYDDIIGISDAVMELFPDLSWSWIIDCELRERYETPINLLKVRAAYDFFGNFYTTEQEMAFFNRIFNFYFDLRYRKRRDDFGGPDDF